MNAVLRRLEKHYPELAPILPDIARACDILIECFSGGGKLLLCGNGGSAADCEHIAGELMKEFTIKRHLPEGLGGMAGKLQNALPAIPLASMSAFATAWLNDADPAWLYAQQVYALGREGDALLAVSTSGNAENVFYACHVASLLGMPTVALTGHGGGMLAVLSDVTIRVPATETYRVQEYHLPVYHAVCEVVEKTLFGTAENQP
jgi:D-sedoheptulose 7-phosphate isomerase